MEPARFEALATRLLDSLGDRMADQQKFLRGHLWAGEEDMAIDELVGELVFRKTAITQDEREMVRELLWHFGSVEPEFYPYIHDRENAIASLNVVEGP